MKNNIAQKNSKENILFDLLHKYKLFPQRLLIIAESGKVIYSYSDKKFKNLGYGVSFYDIFSSSRDFKDRGKILDDILKLEFLISQIILIKLSNKEINFFDYKEIGKWNKFLDNIPFNRKIDFLSNFDLINKKDWKVLDKIRKLRNQAAHSFNSEYLEYNENIKDRREQFRSFREDLKYIWEELSKIYHKIWSADEIFDHAISIIEKKYAK